MNLTKEAEPASYSVGPSDDPQFLNQTCVEGGGTSSQRGRFLAPHAPHHQSAFRFQELVSCAGSPKPDGIPEASYITASKTLTSRQNPARLYAKQCYSQLIFRLYRFSPTGAYGDLRAQE